MATQTSDTRDVSVRFDDGRLVAEDGIEGTTAALATSATAAQAVSTDRLPVPVDTAHLLDTGDVVVPKLANVVIRPVGGGATTEASNRMSTYAERGEYTVQIHSLGIICYLYLTGDVATHSEDGQRHISTDASSIVVGFRSLHERPQATVSVGSDPESLMQAISVLGSALKTSTAERSWPSLRGFPPLIEVTDGPGVDIPAGLTAGPSRIRLGVPPELQYLYPVTSLAYYLDADVVPASDPYLGLGGETYRIPRGRFEQAIQRLLKHVFTLDCVTRSEGIYPFNLSIRDPIEQATTLDFAGLYDAPAVDRLDAYLSVPFEDVLPHAPAWKLTADVEATADNAPYLPFAAYDLAHVRVPETGGAFNGGFGTGKSQRMVDGFTRVEEVQPFQSEAQEPDVITPPSTETLEHAWVAEGVPVGASKPTAETCLRQLTSPRESTPRVVVIVNDPDMAAETDVGDIYGLRERVEMDVDIFTELTVEQTRTVAASDHDLLHFVGHVTSDGLQCSDGYLDARTLDTVGARAFVLNACRSYEQGRAFLDAGAVGGVVTLATVENESATRVGRQFARLLNAGFSLAAALPVVFDRSATGRQYAILGDGNTSITSTRTGAALSVLVERHSEDSFETTLRGHPTRQWPLGAVFSPHIADESGHYLNSGEFATVETNRAELVEWLDMTERLPVTFDGDHTWTDELYDRLRE